MPRSNDPLGPNLDPATCLAIHRFADDFIIHGKLEITKIDLTGTIEWNFSGMFRRYTWII